VHWRDPEDHARGAEYLYLTDEDHRRLSRTRTLNADLREEIFHGQVERRWRLKDLTDGIGHECLQGSGLIAKGLKIPMDLRNRKILMLS
jgi:acetyl-CoA carboxylase/biotin carboxylase 1